MVSLIEELQIYASSEDGNVGVLFRKAKVVSAKLRQTETTKWIDRELKGYTGDIDELPEYRKLYGQLKAFNPHRGWVPFLIQDQELEKEVTFTPIAQSIGSIESALASAGSNGLTFPLNGSLISTLQQVSGHDWPIQLQINKASLQVLIESARSLILDWAIELEALGVAGDISGFTLEEKRKAAETITNIEIGNLGSAASIGGNASISGSKIRGEVSVDQKEIENVTNTIEGAANHLPTEQQQEILNLLSALKNESKIENKLSILKSVKNVAESAGGSAVGQLIYTALDKIC